jgi:DNA-binding IclR family transcriptional regulator
MAALKRDLAEVRARGYAIAVEEAEPGVTALAVAVRDQATGRALGTTSVAGPLVRFAPARHAELGGYLASTAQELAQAWPRQSA